MEVDGPTHFTANTKEPLGITLARRSLLQARGWRVLSVPYFHWTGFSDEHKVAYLQKVSSAVQEGCTASPGSYLLYLLVGHVPACSQVGVSARLFP